MKMYSIIFLFLSFCLADNLCNSTGIKINFENFTVAVPSKEPVFIFLCNTSCEDCKEFSESLDNIIILYGSMQPNVKFYYIDISENDRVNEFFSEINSYPALAFFKPNDINYTKVYKGKMKNDELNIWIKNNLEEINKSNVSYPIVDFNPSSCETYIKLISQISELKTKIDIMESLIKDFESHNDLIDQTTAKVNIKLNERKNRITKGNSWAWTITTFIIGVIIGYLAWNTIMRRAKITNITV